jgi:hypothetical protein
LTTASGSFEVYAADRWSIAAFASSAELAIAPTGNINISVTKANWKYRIICSFDSIALERSVIYDDDDGGHRERQTPYAMCFAKSAKISAGSSRGPSYAYLRGKSFKTGEIKKQEI